MGANIEATNKEGSTALMLAALGGHEEAVRALLKAGAKVMKHYDTSQESLIVLEGELWTIVLVIKANQALWRNIIPIEGVNFSADRRGLVHLVLVLAPLW